MIHNKHIVEPLSCPVSHREEWVELALSSLPVFQLHLPVIVSCSVREDAKNCGRCLGRRS